MKILTERDLVDLIKGALWESECFKDLKFQNRLSNPDLEDFEEITQHPNLIHSIAEEVSNSILNSDDNLVLPKKHIKNQEDLRHWSSEAQQCTTTSAMVTLDSIRALKNKLGLTQLVSMGIGFGLSTEQAKEVLMDYKSYYPEISKWQDNLTKKIKIKS